MAHFGIISPPVSGHINVLAALGRELLARGHRVTWLQMVDLEEKIRSEGLEFCAIGEEDHPRGSLGESLAQLGTLHGVAAIRFTIRAVARTSVMVCRDAPVAIRRLGLDGLIVDQMEPAGGAVAESLGLPFVNVCCALPLNRDRIVPPPFTPWTFHDAWWAGARNRVGYALSDRLMQPVTAVVAEYRTAWKLPALRSADDSFSRRAQISQMPRALDFPRTALPASFHYVGPIRRQRTHSAAFPWERLDGRPLIFASLGTLQNSREPLFRLFADACKGLDCQLVITHGGGLTDAEAAGLPGEPLVVSYAPQVELLARATLTITHAGLNTVLDSLTHGVPMVTVPITYEQPAIARRVERSGAGRALSLTSLTVSRMRDAVSEVLCNPEYRTAAASIRDDIRGAGGVSQAAAIVEQALT